MKILLSILLMSFCITATLAQNGYTLKIKDTKGQPVKNVVVTAENKAENVTLKATTDATGSAVFNLVEPGTYTFSYLEMKDVASAEVKEGFSGTFTRSVTYDPKGVFAEKPRADRSGITFKTLTPTQLKSQANVGKVIILLKEPNKTLVTNVAVTLVSIKDQSSYIGKSNAAGEAIFYVPVGQDYEIDVANLKAFHVLPVPNHAGLEMTEVVFYEKTKVGETAKGDTIIQKMVTQTTGTSTHVLFTLQLNDYDGNPLANEPVYMDALTGKRVYQGKTDAKGSCAFMLEKGSDYTVNLKHERGIHLVDAPVSQAFHLASATRRYRGSAMIEQLLAEQKAEMERIQEEMRLEALKPKPGDKQYPITYRETPVRTASAPPNYLTKTADGFNLDFKSAGPVGTPTLVENKLLTQEGMYSPNYYCLQASTGAFVWGLELGETGISPAVYHKGVLLINTASCTLYAIDVATGKLLWSKWLAGYVYSTPTAVDNSVFVVYNHGGYPVVVSFDLTSGKFNWMQRVDNEAIACPVVDGDEVHVASQSGTYYVFNKETGKPILTSNSYSVVSSPTLTADKIYVTASFNGTEQLVVLDRKTLKLDKKYPTSLKSLSISKARNVDETNQMNFNGSHPIVYQNKVVIITDETKIMAFDAFSEKQLWQQTITTNPDQLPIVANNKVIITSSTGDIMSYDIMTGTPLLVKKVKGEIEGQPISGNGFLYVAIGGVLTVIKTLQKYEWNQWNKNASHNTSW